jgi:hypothetical protein
VSATPPSQATGSAPPPPVYTGIDADDARRMAPIYIAVVIVEVIVLLAVWGFQEYFG